MTSKKIKICFFSFNIYPLFDPKIKTPMGGAEVQLYQILNGLSQNKDFEVSLITSDHGQPKVKTFNRISIYKSAVMERQLKNYLTAPFKIWQALKKVNADVYISSPAGPEVGVIAAFCKIHKKKYIYRTASEDNCNGTYIKNNKLFGPLFKYGLEKADQIVIQNRDNQKLLQENHGLNSTIIKNSFVINIDKDLEKKGYLLWVGRVDPNKRLDLLVKIAKKLPNEKFLVIGPKYDVFADYYNKNLAKIKTLKNIKYIERVPFEKIQTYYDKAKLFICTSNYEGFPNTHIQACIGKTPICTLNINPDQYITKNQLGYVADGDFNLMLNQIKKLLTNEKDWQEKSGNAFSYVKKYHNIKVNINKWEKLISEQKSLS